MKIAVRMGYGWLILRIALGALFVYASYYKIMSPGAFAHEIYNYKILPPWAINPIAITLPWLQLFCGLALIAGRAVLGASFWIAAMLTVFQIAVASALIRGLNISCGCFESGGDKATWLTFSRDLLLLAAAGLQLWRATRKTVNTGLWMAG
jgi:uncharacterized membrane protein YphA (DoxX/SURF4 family)